MPVRDLFWGCPFCRAPGRIRRTDRRERCLDCGAEFRRGRKATVVARRGGEEQVRTAAEWLELLGPVVVPAAEPGGRLLGPELVRVKRTIGQRPYHYGDAFLGWIETYSRPSTGRLELHADGLRFEARGAAAEHWSPDRITGLQPASSTIQLGFRGHMVSVKFLEGSVRLWTRAVSDLLHRHYEAQGYQVMELQPHIRVCRTATSAT